ncbi:hypothetical protein GCM10023322_61720 [Rugosimonospora acidiphila]|uniref:Uncharacterized protein n=1 Tax=Rugosimonospora acidiphila TaxID=556531 RepID=A0ABP9SIK5_9ACTN
MTSVAVRTDTGVEWRSRPVVTSPNMNTAVPRSFRAEGPVPPWAIDDVQGERSRVALAFGRVKLALINPEVGQ